MCFSPERIAEGKVLDASQFERLKAAGNAFRLPTTKEKTPGEFFCEVEFGDSSHSPEGFTFVKLHFKYTSFFKAHRHM